MAVTSVDIVEAHPNHDDAETNLQNWIDTTTFTTVHAVVPIYEHRGRIGVAIFYE